MTSPRSPVTITDPPFESHARALAGSDAFQREKLSVIGHMASSVAHDLSNPLATIVTSAQAILAFWPHVTDSFTGPEDDHPGNGNAAHSLLRFREDLELILSEAKRAGNIVSNLLALVRNQPPEWGPVSLPGLVAQAVSICRHHLEQYNIVLHVDTGPDGGDRASWATVYGDANRLQQVLLNLITNAQQAISNHGDGGNIWIRLAAGSDQSVTVAVEDDGPGVPPHLHRTIFDPYYTTKPYGQGTGLGLSIAVGIVATHGGKLDVSDRDEGGATFLITLPVADPALLPAPAGLPPTTSPNLGSVRFRGRVLLVDDEAGIRRSAGRFLRRSGCHVETASTGSEAIGALRRDEFDLILSDIRMPGLSGEELFELLCQHFPDMTSRIVFVSGDLLRKETQVFLARCGCPSLQKPYELADLVEILTKYCAASSDAAPSASGT